MTQKIIVASTNPRKVDAVREVLQDYNGLSDLPITSADASSGVSKQPIDLETIFTGAKNRAKGVYSSGSLSVGLESGIACLIPEQGYIMLSVCCIYDGSRFHEGLAGGIPVPQPMALWMIDEGLTLNEAALRFGLTKSHTLGKEQGCVGILTSGRMHRQDQMKQAILTALVSIENPQWYSIS